MAIVALPLPSQAGAQSLRGSVPCIFPDLKAIGELSKAERLDLVIGLPLRNKPALTNLLQQLYDPNSPQYHRFLTPAQFAERFSPTEADYRAVAAYAMSSGLTVMRTHGNRTLLGVNGAVADVNKTFHVSLRTYQHPTEPRTFYAPDKEPTLALNVPILSVSGLNNYTLPRPMIRRRSASAQGASPQPQAGTGPAGAFLGNDFRAAYVPGVPLTGSGQTVGLLELDAFYANDILTYEQLAGIAPVPLTTILVGGYNGAVGANNSEVALDIEMAVSMAPGLDAVVVYEADYGTVGAGNEILNEMAAPSQGEPLSRQLSASWLLADDENTEQIFQQFAAQGQSFFNSSGDYDSYYPPGTGNESQLSVNVTSVGGTTLTTAADGSWLSETVWNWGSIGSSGGVTPYPIPSWQQGIDMSACQGSTTLRNIPDVALTADNIWVVFDHGAQMIFGGTSCAAPLWAGFTALVNEQANTYGWPPVGFINPALYALAKSPSYTNCFHDITAGNNTWVGSPNLYYAVPGYDLCTGLGTPAVQPLIDALAIPDYMAITPFDGFASSGNPGGPLTITEETMALTNAGMEPLNWTVNYSSPWLNVSTNGGALAPLNGSSTVTVSLNSEASNLVPGLYTATLWFTNQNDEFAEARTFTLNVLGAPVVIAPPANREIAAGDGVAFSVTASGATPLSYFWQQNGVNISGATNSTLVLTNVPAADTASQFSCAITNTYGAVTSSVALLTVANPLYCFHGPDGANPCAALVQATDGNFYGTTEYGGAYGFGTVFRLTINGVLTTLVSFNSTNGANPVAGLVQARDGNLYGVTMNGGIAIGEQGYGTFFRMTTNGQFTSLLLFNYFASNPEGGLVQGSDGNLYGTTTSGGTAYAGCVIRLTTTGGLTTLTSFDPPASGSMVTSSLIQGSDGNFYGAASGGGANTYGTVFDVTTNGTLNTFDSFSFLADPKGGVVQGRDGNFYGTTYFGGDYRDGTVFKMTPSGALTTVVSFYPFRGTATGQWPVAGLMQASDGNFYGATTAGGTNNNGTLFETTTNGVVNTFVSFEGADGASPQAAVTQGGDMYLYGTATYGGVGYNGAAGSGNGTIFRVAIPGLPVIVAQPVSQAVNLGGAVTFAVNASNTLPLTYLWLRNGVVVPGATNNVLTLTNVGIRNVGNYNAVITSSFDSVTSAVATLTINNSTCIGPLPGIVAWWRGEGNANDVIGGNNGTLMDGASFTNGLDGDGFAFNGNGSYVQLPENLFPFPNAGPFSIELWFETATGGVILEEQDVPNGWVPDLYVGTDGNLYTQIFWDGAFNQISTTTPVNDGAFHHAAVTFDGINETLYLDGAKAGATTSQYSSSTSNYFCQLGTGYTQYWPAGNGGWFPFNGIIDEVSLYGNALTADQIIAIYNAATAGKCAGELLPAIVAQPINQTILAGQTATFGVTAVSFLPLAYQWFKNGSALTGATNTSYLVTNAQPSDSGAQFGCQISTTQGLTNSATVVLTVMSPPVIVVPPMSLTVPAGGSALFTINVTGTTPFYYLWLSNNTPIARATASNYFLNNIPLSDSGAQFSCLVSNALGTTSSAPALLTVTTNLPPTVLSLYSFGGPDGAKPQAGLDQGSDGNFYGTTAAGGANGDGTVFQFTTNHLLTSLVSFTGTNGSAPQGILLEGSDGNFYGTTSAGGSSACGTVFRVATNGALTSLVSFTSTNDGAFPRGGLVQAGDGTFYGTTSAGGGSTPYSGIYGTVFRMTSNGALTNLVYFTYANGAGPEAGLVWGGDGSLYGTTEFGGLDQYGEVGYGYGTVFKITTNGLLTTLYTFLETNGYTPTTPISVLPASDGYLYGTTLWGGWTSGAGTVFRLTTNGAIAPLVYFGNTNGASPYGGLMQASDGNFYGTTETGGAYGDGTVFKMTTNGVLTTLFCFSGSNGSSPEGILVQGYDGNLYGTTTFGGAGYNGSPTSGNGTIFVVLLSASASPLAITSVALLPTGNVQLTMTGWPGNVFRLMGSTDLLNWQTIATMTNFTGACTFADSATTNLTARFYELVSP